MRGCHRRQAAFGYAKPKAGRVEMCAEKQRWQSTIFF